MTISQPFRRTSMSAAAALVFAGFTAHSAGAAVVDYTDESLFQAAISDTTTIDFSSVNTSNWDGYNTSAGVTVQGVNFVGNFPLVSGYYLYGSTSGYSNFAGFDDHSMLIEGRGNLETTLASGTRAFGFEFNLTEGATGVTKNMTLTLSSGETINWDVVTGTRNFIGITSDTEITSFNFSSTLVERPPQVAFDNFTFATTVAAVPLPAGGLMLLSGLAGFGALRRRKNTAA